jgi:alpha-1,2-mannosyltransferase
MTPFVPLSMGWRNVIWYAISIAATVGCYVLSERFARRLYPVADDARTLFWLRAFVLLLSIKFAQAVFVYQAFDTLAFLIILLGLYALSFDRDRSGAVLLALATSIKATPLIFLPYLIFRRRFMAAGVFTVALVFFCFLPDLIIMAGGAKPHFFLDWVGVVASPALTPGGSAGGQTFWDMWMGQNLNNQSFRGVVQRLAAGTDWSAGGRWVLLALNLTLIAACTAMMFKSPRRNDHVAIDGAILLIATLALSPITSRYHFVLLILPYYLLVAAAIYDRSLRRVLVPLLVVSFVLLTGTSNDLTGKTLAQIAFRYGFLIAGSMVLLGGLGMLLWRRPAKI